MKRILRENAVCALAACGGALALGWLGLYGFAWNDYELEAQPAFEALIHGHFHAFLALAPAYGGSLVERAPFAILASAWHAGPLGVYRMVALPCLLATVLLALWLNARMRAAGRAALARGVTVAIVVANPVALLALEVGHPEELLGAVLCAAAIVLACEPRVPARRALLAGALLGLAIANKEWAVLALGPILLALPPRRRVPFLVAAFAVAGLVELPLLLAGAGSAVGSVGGAVVPSASIFQPWQVWWFLGSHAGAVHGTLGALKPGYRTAPAWTGTVSHPAVLAAGLAVTLGLCRGCLHSRLPAQRAMLALALTLLLRCMLDIWDTSYYLLPMLLAMLVWETRRSEHPPVLTLALSALIWIAALKLPAVADVQAGAFIAWTVPLAAWLAWRLFAPVNAPRPEAPATRGGYETTVRRFGSPVRISLPSLRTISRSSIRTPSASGR